MKLNYHKIYLMLEEFMADINMSYFVDQAEFFMRKNMNETWTEDEAIEFLENNFLFHPTKNKPDVLMAADVLRAIRMIKYRREGRLKCPPPTEKN